MLKVDLDRGKVESETLSKELIEKFIGGWGINLKLFRDWSKPLVDPLSPENPLILGAGPLVGTAVPGAVKLVATTKSPIADRAGKHFIDCAVAGGKFGPMLKKAGYDHVIITGRASEPVYLSIENKGAEILDASDLWGKMDTYETTDWLLRRHPNAAVISIGKAGEKLVRYGMAIVDRFATLGRFGVGAVMGSKNLKAIAVRGDGGVRIAEPDEFLRWVREWRKDIEKNPILSEWRVLGITAGWAVHSPLVREGVWEYSRWAELYGPERWVEFKCKKRNSACYGCPMSCRVDFCIKDGKYRGLASFTGSYMLPARVGQRLELEDPREAVKLLDICNRAGMCYFTTSQLVNWVTRLYGRGKISKKTTGGEVLERKFDVYLRLFEQVASRSGFGKILADGWYPLARRIGADPDEFEEGTGVFRGCDVIQDARFTRLHPQAFSHFTSPRPHHGGTQSVYTIPNLPLEVLREVDAKDMGLSEEELHRIFGDHRFGRFNVGRYARHAEDRMAVYNSLGVCIVHALWGFLGIKYLNLRWIAKIYSSATGIQTSVDKLKKGGERAFTFWKLLNAEEGFSKEDYRCSEVWLNPRKTPEGECGLMDYYGEIRISRAEVEKLLEEYYEERGWDKKTGLPTLEKLKELGLEENFRVRST